MIELDGFEFQYPTATEDALRGVSVSLDQGTVLGVLGPVEAGKTTLSMALAGFVPDVTGGISGGRIRVAGRDPRDVSDTKAAMVFEDYSAQITQLRVLDEVVAPLVNTGTPRDDATERATELLAEFGLEGTGTKHSWELSGGQQQRLAIAAALAVDPEVLVFDTATDMLDPEGRADVTNLVSSLKGEKTLVVTENDPDALVGIADEILVLDDGHDVAYGPAEEVLRNGELLERVGVARPTCLAAANDVGLEASPITIGGFVDAWEDADGPYESGVRTEETDRTTHTLPDGSGDAVIDADGVTYEYPDGTEALADVDLTVRAGEVHAVIGGNGAGKSTLSRLLVGLLKPSAGRVTIGGTETDGTTARALAEDIGIALQNPDEQISRETIRGEIRFALDNNRYRKQGPFGLFGKRERYGEEYIERRIEAVADVVGLPEEERDRDPAFLPRGKRRLVTMAAALAPDPDAIVLDEPAAGVDATARNTIAAGIDRLVEQGVAVVLVEHDMAFVCETADRVTVLSGGEVAMQGPTEAVFRRDNWDWLSERYMRPPRIARLADRLGFPALTHDRFVDRLARRATVAE